MNIVQAQKAIGDSGFYQKKLAFLFSLQWFVVAVILMNTPILFKLPQFSCHGHILSEKQGGCQPGCIVLNGGFTSITTQFNLFCQNSNKRIFGESITWLGSAFGCLFINLIRIKKSFLLRYLWLSTTLSLLLLIFFSNSLEIIFTGLFLAGFNAYPCVLLHFSVMTEQSSKDFNQEIPSFLWIFWSIGEIFQIIVWYYVQNWYMFTIITMIIPVILLNYTSLYYVESPMYYYYLNDQESTIEALNKISYQNNRQIEIKQDQIEWQNNPSQQKIFSMLDLFKDPTDRLNTILICLIMFILQIFYIGNQDLLSNFGLGLIDNGLLTSWCDLVSYSVCYLVSDRIDMKKSIYFVSIMIVLFGFILNIQIFNTNNEINQYQKIVQTILFGFERFIIGFGLIPLQIMINHVFESQILSMIVGFVWTVSCFASSLVPFYIDILNRYNINVQLGINFLGVFNVILLYFVDQKKI